MANQSFWEKSRTHQFLAAAARLLWRPSNLLSTNTYSPGDVPQANADDTFTWGPGGGGGGQVDSIVPGDGIDVDSTDPINPVVSVFLSADAGNQAVFGTDDGLYVPAPAPTGGPYITTIAPPCDVGDPYYWQPALNNDGGATSVFWELTQGVDIPTLEVFPGTFLDPVTGEVAGFASAPGLFVAEIAATPQDGTLLGSTAYTRQLVAFTGIGIPPNTITGCTAWLDATDASTLWQDTAGTSPANTAGQSVKRWDNKASAGKSFQSSTGMTLQTAVVNGNNTCRSTSDGGQRLESTTSGGVTDPLSSYITASAATMTVVLRSASITATGTAYNTSASPVQDAGGYFGLLAATTADRYIAYNYDGTTDYGSVAETLNAFAVVTIQHTGGNMRIRVNRGSWTTFTSGNTTSLAGRLYVGNGNGITPAVFDIQSFAIYNTVLSTGDLDGQEDYLASLAGITL